MPRKRDKCETPWKDEIATEGEAKRVAETLQRKTHLRYYHYPCCDHWHVTSMTRYKYNKVNTKKRRRRRR